MMTSGKSYQRLDGAMLKYIKVKWAEEQGRWDVKMIVGRIIDTSMYLACAVWINRVFHKDVAILSGS